MGRRGTTRALVAAAAGVALLAAACVEKVEVTQGSGGTTNPAAVVGGQDAGSDAVISAYAGEQLSFGTVPDVPARAEGEPIRVGMINQEDTPLGSFPELRLGAQAAVDFINAELGGVDGRPLELIPCTTTFSPERSRACAQQLVGDDVVAVLGGIDITSNGSIPVLEENGMAYVGGIPVNDDEMRSPVSFQFSGGAAGAMVAFAAHAAEEGDSSVAVVYGDFPSIKAAALDYGVTTLRSLGIDDVREVPFPVLTTDFLPVLTKAAEGDPDAIFLAAADTACAPAMRTAHDLGIEAKLYLVGACAAPTIADQVGPDAVEGRIFNIESDTDPGNREGALYFDAVARYGSPDLPAASAATVTFRSVMNLYAVLVGLGADGISRPAVLDDLRAARNRPSFDGYPYTCDGEQVPGLPALCAAQQVLVERRGDELVTVTDWVDVPGLLHRALDPGSSGDGG